MMRATKTLSLLLACVLGLAREASAPDDKAVKLLESWVKAYRGGRLELNGKKLLGSSIAVKAGYIAKDEYRDKTHEDELRVLCEKTADVNDQRAASALLQVAAVGLDTRGKYEAQMNPALVRTVGEQNLDRLTERRALDWIAEVAGKPARRSSANAQRMAAIRCLGRLRDSRYRAVVEAALAADDALVRLHAADAICAGQFADSLPSLTERLGAEEDPLVQMRIVDAMYRVYEGNKDSLAGDAVAAATTAVGAVVGNRSWRVDLAAVQFLESVRRKDSVAPLIDILVRFAAADPEESYGADLSGVVRHRAHDALLEVTGATIAMEDPDRWVEWWQGAEATFVPAEKKVDFKGKTTTGEFFGVPVEGVRLLFVVDTSGSMQFPKSGKVGGRLTGTTPKLAVAKEELLKAVEKLPPGSQFNVVQFGTAAKEWQKSLVPNDKATLKKFERYIDKLSAGGGTNIWDGLRLGLQIHSLVHGETFGVDVDEMFLLSDGLPSPTIGEVWEPEHIIRLIDAANEFAKVKINTIYIAGDPKEEERFAREIGMSGADLMRKIAERNGGRFVEF